MLLRDTVDRVLPARIRLGSAVQSSTPAQQWAAARSLFGRRMAPESVFRADVVWRVWSVRTVHKHPADAEVSGPGRPGVEWPHAVAGTAWVEPYLDGRTMIMAGDGQRSLSRIR
ncbi:MAG: hypothetical protein KF739_07490 [Cryobacterium sp.]|nr:hypothetical protein [Cryobacterium sp.]